MSEKDYKIKCENLFKKNTVLLNQQKIDAEQIRALQKQNGELTDKVKKLEAQIQKMKCCDNCQHCGCGSCDEAGNCICDDCNEDTLSEWECIL